MVDGVIKRNTLVTIFGIPFEGMREAERKRLLTPTTITIGRGGGITYTPEDAEVALLANRFAEAYGFPFVTMLRLVKDRRAHVDPKTGKLVLTLP
jgi:hypothetical protein